MCQNANYGRAPNVPRFRVCQVSAHASVAHGSEYDWISLNNAYGRVQNMPGQRFTGI